MSQFWKATAVTTTSGSTVIQVVTGDDVSLISPNSLLQVGTSQLVEVKTVNTTASPQTIELFYVWNGASGSGQNAISAPTKAEIKAAAEEIRALRVTYEGLANSISASSATNSLVKRTPEGRIKATPSSEANDVVVRSEIGTAAALDANDVVVNSDIGTAAALDVTTSATDTTAGRLTKVGDFGIGGNSLSQSYSDWLSVPWSIGGKYAIDINATNRPAGIVANFYVAETIGYSAGTALLRPAGSGRLYNVRVDNPLTSPVFVDVVEILTSDKVTTSATDATAGRITKVGDFGLGSIAPATLSDALLTSTPTGVYRFDINTAGKPPLISFGTIEIFNIESGSAGVAIAHGHDEQRTFINYRRDATYQGWYEVLTSNKVTTSATDTTDGRLTKTGDFGWGTSGFVTYPLSNIDINTVPSGSYSVTSAQSGTYPSSFSDFGIMTVERFDGNEAKQTYFDIVTNRIAVRELKNTGNSAWTELLTNANVTINETDATIGRISRVGDFGIGHTDLPDTSSSADAFGVSGSIQYLSGGSSNLPSGQSDGYLNVVGNNANENQTQLFFKQTDNKMFLRSAGAGVFKAWCEILTTDNTNNNVFGGQDTDDNLARGVAINGNTILFSLPISMKLAPSSITIVGTFAVAILGSSTFGSGSTPTLSSQSNAKTAVVSIEGLSGLTQGQAYSLFSDSASSKITVNP
jgi:hypothetical protein